jgi:Acetyltransferase (GNAT) domain
VNIGSPLLAPQADLRSPVIDDALTPTIFHEPWWLDTATRRQWKAVESFHDGFTVGRMPYLCGSKFWFKTSAMPMLTHFLGPAVHSGSGSPNTQLLHRIAITRDLVRRLPKIASFGQRMHRGVKDVIAFQMEGFEPSVQFTYELEPAPPDVLWRQMRDKTRNVARKAQNIYTVDDTIDAEEFIWLYRQNLLARSWDEIIDLDIAKQLLIACCSRGCGQGLVARNGEGIAKAAIFCVWDRSVCYYLLSTRTPDSGNGAITLLLWSAIRNAAATGLVFDFYGLGNRGAVKFYTGFGAEIRPRYIISQSTLSFRLLREARGLFRKSDNPFFEMSGALHSFWAKDSENTTKRGGVASPYADR